MAAQLGFFRFLLDQASDFGLWLIPAAATFLVLFRRDRERLSRLLALPAFSLIAIALGAAFVEPAADAKTADWIGYVALLLVASFLIAAIWMISTLKGTRIIASLCVVANAPFAMMSAFVLAIASGGTWP